MANNIIPLFMLILFTACATPSGENQTNNSILLTQQETESFNLIYHDRSKEFPLVSLETLEGESFDPGYLNRKIN